MKSARALLGALAFATLVAQTASAVTTINVEIDWMATSGPGAHSHQPSQAEINAVVQMFACHGITLNVVIDEQVPETTIMPDGPNPNDFFSVTGPGTYLSYWNTYFDHLGQAGWHYCVFGHQYRQDSGATNSSGLAQLGGYALVVTLGSFTGQIGTSFDRASTFAHELGHNLGLTHAGSLDQAVVGTSQPIYASIMSYMYQLRGVKTQLACLGLVDAYHMFKDLDYSNGRMPNVNEDFLLEARGVGISKVDWDCSGVINAGVIHQDLEDDGNGRWCGATGGRQLLSDKDDWTAVLATLALSATSSSVDKLEPRPYEVCVSSDEWFRAAAASNCTPVQPTLVSEACTNAAQMVWVDANWPGSQSGIGSAPWASFASAYASSPDGSLFYLQPGTYHTGTGVISRPLVLCGPGSAILDP